MGTWLATIRFPDGAVRFASYSTVVESVGTTLHPGVRDDAGRAQPAGEPFPRFPDAPQAPIGDLILVTVEREPDDDSWHALYCPNRADLVGPLSPHYRYRLQEEYDLVRDEDGTRHLCEWAGEKAECGRVVTGEPLGLQYPAWGMGIEPSPAYRGDPPPAPDLFEEWDAPDICRPCLLAWLKTPEVPAPAVFERRQPRPWWRFGR
ncbi:hypothetical protein AB0M02_41855 [Actinoplanes sp. NPDC051861]|uniref:hypothetical protein n=1 Tax=Actinoplanes sp. NPDC051861 TaxID=3155170 RepID=UPI0034163317